jgi:hypothetical protein
MQKFFVFIDTISLAIILQIILASRKRGPQGGQFGLAKTKKF